MTEKVSFTRYENVIYPGFRQKIKKAESILDIKNSFVFACHPNLFLQDHWDAAEGNLSLWFREGAIS